MHTCARRSARLVIVEGVTVLLTMLVAINGAVGIVWDTGLQRWLWTSMLLFFITPALLGSYICRALRLAVVFHPRAKRAVPWLIPVGGSLLYILFPNILSLWDSFLPVGFSPPPWAKKAARCPSFIFKLYIYEVCKYQLCSLQTRSRYIFFIIFAVCCVELVYTCTRVCCAVASAWLEPSLGCCKPFLLPFAAFRTFGLIGFARRVFFRPLARRRTASSFSWVGERYEGD